MKNSLLSKLTAILICSAVILFNSCKNDTELINLRQAPTAADFKALRETALANITQTKTFKVEDGLQFTSSKGAQLNISSNCIRKQNGDPAIGDVKLSFVEIYDRGTMALTNKPVMGKNTEGDLLPLVTGGQYNIKITQGNEELRPGCFFSVKIPATNTGTIDNDMKLWKGTIDENGNLTWEENEGQKEGGLGIDARNAYYNIFGDAFGWTNVDRFYSDTRPKTKIKVTVPNGYSDQNSSIYLAYEDQPNLLAQLDVYNTTEKYFSEHYGFVPIDLNVHVIFVSENNGAVAYAIKKVKITANASINISDSEVNTDSMAQLVSLINNLN